MRYIFIICFLLILPLQIAQAGPPPNVVPINNSEPVKTDNPCDFWDGINHSSQMFGDLCGVRSLLARYGMTLNIQETSEVLGNVTGGVNAGLITMG